MRGRRTKGELRIAGVRKTPQPSWRACGQRGGSESGAAVPCPCKGAAPWGQASPGTPSGLGSRPSPAGTRGGSAGSPSGSDPRLSPPCSQQWFLCPATR